jgi:hypothetical protein
MNNSISGSLDGGGENTGIPKIIDRFIEEQLERDRVKDKFINPRSSYSGEFTPENLILDANIQEFANRTSIICALENGGKLTPREAYEQIKQLWADLSRSKKLMFGDD